MSQYEAGQIVTLKVLRKEGSTWILGEQHERQLIPMNESDAPELEDDATMAEVFLFTDRKEQLRATTVLPSIKLDTYGWAKVIKVDPKEGVSVDIGTTREAIVKREDLPRIKTLWPEVGDHLYMTLRLDRNGHLFGRLATEEKVMESYIEAPSSVFNENFTARAYRLLPVGSFFLTVPEQYRIFVHQSEQEEEPRLGQDVEVRIIGVKEDGSLNGSRLPRKQERLGEDAETVLRYLREVGGKMPFSDKSAPEEISDMFSMSKAAFKRALGRLYKDSKIEQRDGWTYLKE